MSGAQKSGALELVEISDFCDLEEHQSCMPVEISNFFVENILQTKIKLSCLKKRK